MTRPAVSLVAAIDRRLAIGRDNALPWRLADDLRRFKSLTAGKPMLMGRKTAEALGRALPGRRNLVLTRGVSVPHPGMEAVASVEQALQVADADELMVIGGGEVYALTLPLASTLHLTFVDTEVACADAFFPAFDRSQWKVTFREPHARDDRNEHAFEYIDYRRA